MKLPSLEECEAMMRQYEVPEHVRGHTGAVRKVTNFLAIKISENGMKVDLELVDRAALMHDFMKLYCIKNNCRHSEEAEKVLSRKGYPEFGGVVRQHGLDEVLNFGKSTFLEAKIVWYADKRVNHDQIVSLKERYDYLKEKYGSLSKQKMEEIILTEKFGFGLEKELLKLAGVSEKLEGIDDEK